MSDTRKRRSAWLGAAGVALGLLMGLPGGASASCDPTLPPRDADRGDTPPGGTVVEDCSRSPFDLGEIGRRH